MSGSVGFDEEAGKTVIINYSLPLPGRHTGRRIMELDLGLDPEADFLPETLAEGETFASLAGVSSSGQVDQRKADVFLRSRLARIGYGADQIDGAMAMLPKLLDGETVMLKRIDPDRRDDLAPAADTIDVIEDPVLGDPIGIVSDFVTNANAGLVAVPTTNAAGKGDTAPAPPEQDPEPRLFLIEKYAVSSFLGDYGMGRTVRTFTLLPGESTTIRLKTWQSSSTSAKNASSIIDSHEQSARDRFSRKMQDETTDRKTQAQTESWSVEAEAKAGWGWGSASVKGTAAGEYQSGREQFARQATESVGEHARKASSKRELSVTSSSETTNETGLESIVEREIANINMRRVMNFVFRELNQQYTTKLHLVDISVGYTNGLAGTWREVPVSGLRRLLSEVLVPNKIDEVALDILRVARVVFDRNDTPAPVLERIDYDSATDTISVSGVSAQDLVAPTDETFYRFRTGPLSQDGSEEPVDGVLLSEQTIVMRTDSVIVEALLGEADALDDFAMEIQHAAASKQTLANERERMLQNTLSQVSDPETRASLAAALFNPPVTT